MTTLQAATAEFLLHLRACGRSEHTVAQYERHLAALARYARWEGRGEDLGLWTNQNTNAFLLSSEAILGASGAKRAPGTVNGLRGTVQRFFAWAEAVGLVRVSPARLVQRARTAPPPPRALSAAQQGRLLAALDAARAWPELRDRALVRFLLGTGVRLGAALALRVEDVDLDSETIEITTKGGVRARLPISRAVRELLVEWLPEEGPVFTSRSGGALSPRQAQTRLRSWCRRAGIRPASPHALRHSFATDLLARTGDAALVQAALVHRSIASTMIYARVSGERLRAALSQHGL